MASQHIIHFHFETFAQNICNLFSKFFLFLIVRFSYILGNFDIFSHALIFTNTAFWLIPSVLTFAKFVKFLKRSTDRGDRYFLTFQSNDMLNLCLNTNESKPIYAFKRFVQQKKQTCQNTNLFVTGKRTKLLSRTFFNVLLEKEILCEKKKYKSHTCDKEGHTSEFPFGIYWWTLKNPKYQNFEKWKKFAGDIIILHMGTKNHNHMRHSSWDTEWDIFLSFWAICVPQMTIIWYMVLEISSGTG